MAFTKLLVSNRSALTAKYGAAGMARVDAAIASLVAADAARGVTTTVAYLDDSKAAGKAAVKTGAAAPRHKAAFERLMKKHGEPDYVVLLGAVDVIPHQELVNPIFDGTNDVDRIAFSDLPYACAVAASSRIEDFLAPTRVLSRIPDLTGATDPAFLERVLSVSAAAVMRPRSAYGAVFGLSAKVWNGSTSMSMAALGAGPPNLAPSRGPSWPAADLAPRMHFINCHGAQADEHFYGQDGNNFPFSFQSSDLPGKIQGGAVAAVECCYGAELYAPTGGRQHPTCCRYLEEGAYGYFGSTTIAYGPATGNGQADLIARYFLQAVRDGSSLGSAALFARQEFVRNAAPLDPAELKTIAQFVLYGDASVRPVQPSGTGPAPKGVAMRGFASPVAAKALTVLHRARRRGFAKLAAQLAVGVDTFGAKARARAPKAIHDDLARHAAAAGLVAGTALSFSLKSASSPKTRAALVRKGMSRALTSCHVVSASMPAPPAAKGVRRGAGHDTSAVPKHALFVARERDGEVEIRTLWAHGRGAVPLQTE
jgi:hypothetical protein